MIEGNTSKKGRRVSCQSQSVLKAPLLPESKYVPINSPLDITGVVILMALSPELKCQYDHMGFVLDSSEVGSARQVKGFQ